MNEVFPLNGNNGESYIKSETECQVVDHQDRRYQYKRAIEVLW